MKAFRIPRSQAKIRLYSAPEARCTSPPSFFYRGGTSRGRAMEDGREPAGGRRPPGSRAPETANPNGERSQTRRKQATWRFSSSSYHRAQRHRSRRHRRGQRLRRKRSQLTTYHNSPQEAYNGATPVLVKMVPEIATQAADASELSGRFRGVLAMARGMLTGARANSSTSGAHIWASLTVTHGATSEWQPWWIR